MQVPDVKKTVSQTSFQRQEQTFQLQLTGASHLPAFQRFTYACKDSFSTALFQRAQLCSLPAIIHLPVVFTTPILSNNSSQRSRYIVRLWSRRRGLPVRRGQLLPRKRQTQIIINTNPAISNTAQ